MSRTSPLTVHQCLKDLNGGSGSVGTRRKLKGWVDRLSVVVPQYSSISQVHDLLKTHQYISVDMRQPYVEFVMTAYNALLDDDPLKKEFGFGRRYETDVSPDIRRDPRVSLYAALREAVVQGVETFGKNRSPLIHAEDCIVAAILSNDRLEVKLIP